MLTPQDPNAFQSWMIAIPSAITALSTWYLNRKTVKTGKQSSINTQTAIEENAAEIQAQIKELQQRVTRVEEAIGKTRDAQIIISQKHTESMSSVSSELRGAKEMIQKMMGSKPGPASPASAAPSGSAPASPSSSLSAVEKVAAPVAQKPETGKVVLVDEPPQPHGKVILKP